MCIYEGYPGSIRPCNMEEKGLWLGFFWAAFA